MNHRRMGWARLTVLGTILGAIALTSCRDPLTSDGTPPPATPATPVAPTSPDVPISRQPVTCNTTNYFAEVLWENNQPLMSFLQKPNLNNLSRAQGVTVTSNPDGSTTYGYQGETIFYARVFPDGTCFVQSLTSSGQLLVEESGRIAEFTPAPPPPAPTPAPPVTVAPEEPNQDNLSMTCNGTVQERVDFTAFYTREAGFSRVEFRPRTSTNVLTSNLSYVGKNAAGETIWKGNVAQMADTTLVHLSPFPAKPGDQVSVSYDGQWGRATCQ
ncbi:hypothetical protein [Thermoleptolyngbya sp. C42_A2020_037]|uniref:hypothetical protein n=1 Tax=Thermoleptolyngbya sp. C42_A2020_037 TaxID=2747799 RepID=UPI001A01959B|nr:hypothetical protein [Thermoleptolyngbya sp. C42_A2020_037]MBF2084503.1 hypothetical protein [Thermoleptolyngbya sp. C42_A2020_037]